MMMPLITKRDLVGLVVLVAALVAVGLMRLPLPAVLLTANSAQHRHHHGDAAARCGVSSDANPLRTLVLTFGVMSLFAVGGANSAIPESTGPLSTLSTG